MGRSRPVGDGETVQRTSGGLSPGEEDSLVMVGGREHAYLPNRGDGRLNVRSLTQCQVHSKTYDMSKDNCYRVTATLDFILLKPRV